MYAVTANMIIGTVIAIWLLKPSILQWVCKNSVFGIGGTERMAAYPYGFG
jgi:hypothetical protein